MEAWRSTLLRYSRGYNPYEWFQIPFLSKTLEIAKEAHKDRDDRIREEAEQIAKDKAEKTALAKEEAEKLAKEKASEYKNIILSKEDHEYAITRINREKLEIWRLAGLSIRKKIGGAIVDDFEELVDSAECYYLIDDGRSKFGGYSRVEGDVQTQDCVASILKGVVSIDNFHSSISTKVIFEYNMAPPKAMQAEMEKQKFKFPIRPDALLILGETWLFLESKHKVTKRDIYLFEQKMRFVIKHMDQYWVFQNQTPPKKILYAMSSTGQFDAEALEAGESVIKILCDGAEYRLLKK